MESVAEIALNLINHYETTKANLINQTPNSILVPKHINLNNTLHTQQHTKYQITLPTHLTNLILKLNPKQLHLLDQLLTIDWSPHEITIDLSLYKTVITS